MKQEAIGLATVLGMGIAAQWVAWKLRLPAILLLLISGIVLGPVFGVLNPDALFGDLLLPIVSISVGIILFEGGLSLSISDLREGGPVIRNLVTLGVAITAVVAALAAWLFLGLAPEIAVLLGAILSVTGPTVIQPLLRHIRPTVRVNNILKWEGILIDPVGALLSVLVFEVVGSEGMRGFQIVEFGASLLIGAAIGVAGAAFLVLLFRFHQVPDFLDSAFTLATVIGVFSAANAQSEELGLLSTTVMGIALANQRFVAVRRIVEFKEHLRVVILSSLFVILAARMEFGALSMGWPRIAAFLVVLFVIARPAAVWLCCLGSKVSTKERVFLSWMAPRGIVAAAVASVFAERLSLNNLAGAELLVPITFATIIVTVAIYGLTASPLARYLGIAESSPEGLLILGAHSWARDFAGILRDEGIRVVMVDSNWQHVTAARLKGVPAHFGGVLSQRVLDEIELYGISRLLALTSNDEANSLAAVHFRDIFGGKEVYQLAPAAANEARRATSLLHLNGRRLFADRADFQFLSRQFESGAILKKTSLTQQFTIQSFREQYGEGAIPLVSISRSKRVHVMTARDTHRPQPGDMLVSLIPAEHRPKAGDSSSTGTA